MENLVQTLETLSNAFGPSGSEMDVRHQLREWVESHAQQTYVDALGNLLITKHGTKRNLHVMVSAHMDEVGLMVVGYTNGNLRVATIGGIDPSILPGLQVLVSRKKYPGVIGVQAIHRTSKRSREQVIDIDDLAVDIGAKDENEARKLAPLGTPIIFATRFRAIGEKCSGKAFDNRAGCTVLTKLLQGEAFPCDVTGAFTVQEEVGLRGASVAAYTFSPDLAIVLEGTVADDLPKEEKDVSPTTELGKGPAITVKDRSYVTYPPLLRHVIRTAQEMNIPYQIKQPGVSSTESGAIHRVRVGIPSITISVPCRYIHSPVSVLNLTDLENTIRLVRATLATLPPDILEIK